MELTTKWQKDQKFIATTQKGYSISMDGDGSAPSPMELILAAVAGCSSIDVVLILEKGRHKISKCDCKITSERASAVPAVFTKINAHYLVSGNDLQEKTVERACKLSIEKYCSTALMLSQSVEISFSFEIL